MGDAALKTSRAAAIAALSTSLILTTGTPAFAADVPVDTVAPVVDNTGLTDGQFVTRTTVLVPTVSDDSGVVRLETYVDGAHRRVFGIGANGPRATLDLADLTDGMIVDVTVRAYDAAGNAGERTTRVVANPIAPTGTVSPPLGTEMTSGPVTVSLVDVPDDLAKVSMILVRNNEEIAVRTAAPWSFDWMAKPGSQFYFKLTDVAGNFVHRVPGYVVDDYAPVVSDIDWSHNFVLGSTTTVHGKITAQGGTIGADATLSATVSDSTLDRIEWWVDGALYSTGSSTITWKDRVGTRRSTTIEIRATDRLGHATTKVFPVVIDPVGPVVTSITPGDRALVRGSYFVTNVKVTNPDDLEYSELVGLPSIANAPAGLAIYPAKDGPLSFTWRLIDPLGNETFASRTVIVDRTRPTLKLTKAPANKAKVKGTVAVTASAADKNGIAKVQLLINGKLVATDYRAGYAFSINTAKYGKTFTMQLRAYDRAGNSIVTSTRTYRR
ncbi:hypothetical protein Areg01_49940 [Actinoplanes regularis]|nr:hypothetical protein Areg01_49940 [Actinoplanes regularis]